MSGKLSNGYPLVQWSFLQYKKTSKVNSQPVPSFLHSCTQIGSKLLIYGGCDYHGNELTSLFMYDTASYQWSAPNDESEYQEDHPGPRYGHSATLIDMHPPRVLIYGGLVGGGTFSFKCPNGLDDAEIDTVGESDENLATDENGDYDDTLVSRGSHVTEMKRNIDGWRKKGKENSPTLTDYDDRVYFLELKADKWIWSKPLVYNSGSSSSGGISPDSKSSNRPKGRTEHTACKIGTNEVAIFGGWADRPTNELWIFHTVDMEWRECTVSGIRPKPRFRHTCELLGNTMYVMGGSDNGEDIADGCRYLGLHALHLDSMEWSHPEIRGLNPFPRSGDRNIRTFVLASA